MKKLIDIPYDVMLWLYAECANRGVTYEHFIISVLRATKHLFEDIEEENKKNDGASH